jgi:hypothetical protein
MSYQLKPHQVNDLAHLITQRSSAIAEIIAHVVHANASHARAGSVNLCIKVCRNEDDPRLIEVWCQEKWKAPKSKFSDLSEWDEAEMIITFKTSEDPGQQKISEN